jgi:hypothetical protein
MFDVIFRVKNLWYNEHDMPQTEQRLDKSEGEGPLMRLTIVTVFSIFIDCVNNLGIIPPPPLSLLGHQTQPQPLSYAKSSDIFLPDQDSAAG